MAHSIAEPRAHKRLTDRDWQVSNTTSALPVWATLTGAAPGRRTFRFPFDEGALIVEVVEDPPAWVEPTVRSLGQLLRLAANWDTYGGRPVDPNCVAAALDLVFGTFTDDTPTPSVVPTNGGGLQFEWHTRGADLELEFRSATRLLGLFEDQITGESWEKDLTSDLEPFAKALSTLSQRR